MPIPTRCPRLHQALAPVQYAHVYAHGVTQAINADLSPQLKSEMYKWNTRSLLSKTPLLSLATDEGDVERSFISVIVGHLEAHVSFTAEIILNEGDSQALLAPM